MRSVLERMARVRREPLHLQSPQQARASYEGSADVLEVPRRPLARIEDIELPARDGVRLPARVYQPDDRSQGVLLYLHGGGFTIGSIGTHDILCRELAGLAGCAVLSLGYRLAPEHRFPVAVEDTWDALQGLAGQRTALGWRADEPIAVGGDSAGGTLAAVAALHARDRGLPLSLQLLFYPGTAARQDSASHRRYHQGLVLEPAHIEYFFGHYIDLDVREDWRFAPLNAPDVDGVAPAWIGLADCDPLFDDGIAYGDKLRAAGVAVELEVWRGVTHEFIKMGRALPEARQAHAAAARALSQAFRTP
ncbi:alpha/beta hydrolase [Ramlibacter tataouinensis]|uniref:alpha/beta hydrolase n=1 Tax=Ramlibacter tataouinensis TaxID=94132 RepID=UPI0022F3E367|nr:alpha/beta hydrolase [Ramlibacter tataouinensis]WBY04082.1 alpha/beta hydrolase [Ramlibacter tataouinensis]